MQLECRLMLIRSLSSLLETETPETPETPGVMALQWCESSSATSLWQVVEIGETPL